MAGEILSLVLLVIAGRVLTSPDDCSKIWSQHNQTCESCKCGDSLGGAILCGVDSLHIQPCFCLFYDQTENKTIAGTCLITCFGQGPLYYKHLARYFVENASKANSDMCGISVTLESHESHREGRFCGKCKKGYGLAAYSYHYVSCIPCTDYSYKNWLRYFAVALLPLTLFYLLVVLLKIDFTSSYLAGRVFAVQCMLSPLQWAMLDAEMYFDGGVFSYISHTVFGVIGVLNLDFFRMAYPYFCIHPQLNILHIMSLDFIVGLYPFLLVFLTYLLVSMYDRNYFLVVWAWKPFKACISHYWRGYNVKGSLIQTFASFILLSNVKLLGVCFGLLVPNRAYDTTGTRLSKRFLYYDATIEYFGTEHVPFAVLALCIGFVFIFLPFLLLLIYPCRCFQKVLNCLGWRCQILHVFMDAFQGSYKTEPYDLRHFSAYYLFLRFMILLQTAATETISYMMTIILSLLVAAIVFALFQPYKDDLANKVDTVILLSMAMLYTALTSYNIGDYLYPRRFHFVRFTLALATIFCFFLAIKPFFVFLVRVLKLRTAVTKIRELCRGRDNGEAAALIDNFNTNRN